MESSSVVTATLQTCGILDEESVEDLSDGVSKADELAAFLSHCKVHNTYGNNET